MAEVGRPSIYTKELADKICAELASGKSLRTICYAEGMPNAETVHRWVLEDREGFSKQYARAREIQAEVMFDEILEISDESDRVVDEGNEKKSSAYAQNQRLKVDSRKWYLSKVLPKKFGEKTDITSDGKAIEANTIILKNFNGTETNS